MSASTPSLARTRADFSADSPQGLTVPVESASGVATINGTTATCAVEIPLTWTVEISRGGVSHSYKIDAVNAPGSVVRTTVQQGIAEPFPSSGGTSSVTFNVTF